MATRFTPQSLTTHSVRTFLDPSNWLLARRLQPIPCLVGSAACFLLSAAVKFPLQYRRRGDSKLVHSPGLYPWPYPQGRLLCGERWIQPAGKGRSAIRWRCLTAFRPFGKPTAAIVARLCGWPLPDVNRRGNWGQHRYLPTQQIATEIQ